jgi:hypothetical protein
MDGQNEESQNGGPNRTGPVPQGISEKIRAWLQSLPISDHHSSDDMAEDERPGLPLAATRGRATPEPTRRPNGTDQELNLAHARRYTPYENIWRSSEHSIV